MGLDPNTTAYLLREAGAAVSTFIKVQLSKPKKSEEQPAEESQEVITVHPKPVAIAAQPKSITAIPTADETADELKRRLGRELYKAELDLIGGLRIAGKPCTCLESKHTLMLEAAAEELIPEDPSNPVYREIIDWVKANQGKVTVEAIAGGNYAGEYPVMAGKFREFRKRVMGTVAAVTPKPEMTLEEAKKLAAEKAAEEVERKWDSQEKKS
jgi:hypothetical protein